MGMGIKLRQNKKNANFTASQAVDKVDGLFITKGIREVEVNLAYRWFLGYGLQEKSPISQHSAKIMNDGSKRVTCLKRFLYGY